MGDQMWKLHTLEGQTVLALWMLTKNNLSPILQIPSERYQGYGSPEIFHMRCLSFHCIPVRLCSVYMLKKLVPQSNFNIVLSLSTLSDTGVVHASSYGKI